MSEIHYHIINTLITLLILTVTYLVIYAIFSRKLENKKSQQRFKVRLFYGMSFILLFVIAKIWVDGFTHLVAVLSLVSAALVVTNKEVVMNLVGWLIINWRELFTEGDYIQLQEFSGYVYELGILYFKLLEASKNSAVRTSGKMIKVPNGLVINNPIINYSQQSNFIEYEQQWILTPDSNVQSAKELFSSTVSAILRQYYGNNGEYSLERLKYRNKFLSRLVNFEVHVNMGIKQDEPSGVELRINYYCYPKDHDNLDQEIKIKIFDQIVQSNDIQLTYE